MKKQLKEWGILVGILGFLYFTGLHVEVAGFVQRIVLTTGIMQPDIIDTQKQAVADYNFQLEDQEGNSISFDQFKGKTIFLNFWATWCPPCVAEMPDIHGLYEKMLAHNVAFVMISLDDDFSKAKRFVARKEYEFPIYQMVSRRPDVFASRSIPTTFVISPEGKIIAQQTGMAKYDTEGFRNLLLENNSFHKK
jgi:thiol-disulfide isomerase/thioredoxin